MKIAKNKYNNLLKNIGSAIETGRDNALSALNKQILITYWEVGRHIVEFEQQGKERAEYGTQLLRDLSNDLKLRYGKGFGLSNLQYMRLFYIQYPKFQTASGIYQTSGKSSKSLTRKSQTSGKLTWSHYCELLSVSDDMSRAFYQQQSVKENWSVRELKRQIDSALFQRLH